VQTLSCGAPLNVMLKPASKCRSLDTVNIPITTCSTSLSMSGAVIVDCARFLKHSPAIIRTNPVDREVRWSLLDVI
jgi:hypothetical protein